MGGSAFALKSWAIVLHFRLIVFTHSLLMKKGDSAWLKLITQALFPATCILCNRAGVQTRDLCDSCYHSLPKNTSCCLQCAEALPIVYATPMRCGRCQHHQPAFDYTIAPFLYQEPLSYFVTGLKFRKQFTHARLLGQLLAEQIQLTQTRPELLLPIPLHPSRYRARGFNQALEIARTVSQQLHIPLDLYSCKRKKNTSPQTQLSAQKRQQNLTNAFSVVPTFTAKHVAILDDVMTTGATSHALALALKKVGVQRVEVWICARA